MNFFGGQKLGFFLMQVTNSLLIILIIYTFISFTVFYTSFSSFFKSSMHSMIFLEGTLSC